MTGRKQNPGMEDKTALYAATEDFCRLFADHVDSLYQLAFLLTADHDSAEHCFLSGLEDCAASKHVFKEWAHSWAKRTVIQLTIRAVQPRPFDADSEEGKGRHDSTRSISDGRVVDRVLSLGGFDRFVFVISVLERYSEHECALLLGCTPSDVREARMRALQRVSMGHSPWTREALLAEEEIQRGSRHG